MKIGVLKEISDQRIALTPAGVKKLADQQVTVLVEAGAGQGSNADDDAFSAAGAKVTARKTVLAESDLLLSIHPPEPADLDQVRKGSILVALFAPFEREGVGDELHARGLRAYSLDMIPRSSLAQAMDVLSSMASIAGYRAVLTAAMALPRYFPMMITAAGTVKPAKVLVLGAGVAGLQAIATAKRLGAQVEASDVRLAAKEEVESLGAQFIQVEGAAEDKDAGGYAVAQSEEFLQRQREEVARRAARADVIITTAQVRGRKAPVLVSKDTVEQMRPGSVIIDLAAASGGNCALTEDGKVVDHGGVKIYAASSLPATLPEDASTLFSNNVVNFVQLMLEDGKLSETLDHDILTASLITPATSVAPK
ncbi:NAD(P) transhydrogenase subunit alpha [Lewinella sp. W8]|uniref:NAD(P) transhydrogenase subunit alpha n=1 Tax=Lewinella sp. W8 TaxID=2528208 RepID=UPI00106770B2|nr:NAD(P) transhydrogenase subunit alpha [Lewinella sp. W8]MTB52497.1 NAD(P)(+) transhydrogenase (Re/Si-specific) subunit alpha [Lewinella sp. W8]